MWSIGKEGEWKAANRNCLWLDSDVKFIKDFNEAILNMFKELKHTSFKDLKENMMVITQQRGIINKEVNWLTRTKQKF